MFEKSKFSIHNQKRFTHGAHSDVALHLEGISVTFGNIQALKIYSTNCNQGRVYLPNWPIGSWENDIFKSPGPGAGTSPRSGEISGI